MAKETKRGRPLRDPDGGVSRIVPIRMTEAEKQTYQLAADKAEMSLSEWIRNRIARAARRELK
jgi:hypothetical protein